MTEPVLSVVAASRNDDHGGSLVERTQWFVDGLDALARRHQAVVELVLVEWNPPDGRPPLAEVQHWPEGGSPLRVKIVTVGASVHRELVGDRGLPMMQMLAKNVGIRRAAAPRILATNIDVLIAPELFTTMLGAVEPRVVYRADRYDVEFPFTGVAEGVSGFDEALAFCRSHPLRYARKDGIYYPGQGRALPIYQSLGDLVSFEAGRAVGRLGARRSSGAATEPKAPASRRVALSSALRALPDRWNAAVSLATAPKLHVNACGDFTLMSAESWSELRGYPEWIVHSWHLDTLLMHQAHGAGFEFVELAPPQVVFHMEHGQGSGWTPEGQVAHFKRVDATGIRTISSGELRRRKAELARNRREGHAMVYNAANWGMANAELPVLAV